MSCQQNTTLIEGLKELEAEREARREKLSRTFGWKYFKTAKPVIFTIDDAIAKADSMINENL